MGLKRKFLGILVFYLLLNGPHAFQIWIVYSRNDEKVKCTIAYVIPDKKKQMKKQISVKNSGKSGGL